MTATRTRTDPAGDVIRQREAALFARYGLTPTEHLIALTQPRVDVRVLEFGLADGPPVLLLHGIASVTALVAPLIGQLSAQRRVLAVDWPGHGLSGPLRLHRGQSIRAHAVAVLDGLYEALDIGRADLAGHSMGAQFSLYFALDRPDRVRRVVTLGAPGAGFAEVRPAPLMRALSVPGLGRALLSLPLPPSAYKRSNEDLLGRDALTGHPEEIADVSYFAARRQGYAPSVASFFHALITPARVRPTVPVSHAELATLTQPVLLLWGDDDLFLDPDRAQPSIAAIPHGRLIRMVGGHAPWLDSPDACGDALREFLGAA